MMDRRIFAFMAIAALAGAGCSSGGGGGATSGLGLTGTTKAMSATYDGAKSSVSDSDASFNLTNLTFDEFGDINTMELTLNLPDGSSATFNQDELYPDGEEGIGPWWGMWIGGENADGDVTWLLIGAGTDPVDSWEDFLNGALFTLAEVYDPDIGWNTYMVAGDKTDTLPTGGAGYYGNVYADVYWQGNYVEYATGGIELYADFDNETVDLGLWAEGPDTYFELFGLDLAIDGSDYGGQVDGYIITPEPDAYLVGDLLGAFFGDNAEATAGVFAVHESNIDAVYDGDDFDIVGGFAAYDESLGL